MDQERVLVTGASGFTGRHLLGRLRADGRRWVIGTDVSAEGPQGLDAYQPCDLTDPPAVAELVARARPSIVFHLAGLLGAAPEEALRRVNVDGLRHLCDALAIHGRKTGLPVRLVVVGSAAELGTRGAARLPVTEDAPCEPESPYGRTKWEATRLALAQPADGPLAVVIARPFNLVGPGLPAALSLGHFARQIADVLRGGADALHCGPLDVRRDFVDVRDAADAYVRLALRGRRGEIYNVCAGKSCRLDDLLGQMIARAGRPVNVLSDLSRRRPGDLADIYGSYAKLQRHTGWEPRIPIEQSLIDLLAEATSAAA